ncbi:phenolic acid decarboxylase [Streptomyces sp. NRRL WC-3742]|uniref:phenolic acid decarboxylase n=1 Tax=Streptomyces sp. NRRL WC-3742 TaxID=1463934 RepID=UPI0004CB8A1B|nr:phenolic acid decarboxylase [Streptomyces sp. NRRL WC-3742]
MTQDLSGIVGHRFIYTYDNGWQYELYVKNQDTVDYRIHSGMVGGRWVKGQRVDLVRLDEDNYKLSWNEPTGTSVVVNIMPGKRSIHGVIFFPHWVEQHSARTVCFQNDHLDQMRAYRDQGPTYPIHMVAEFARITLFEHVGADDDSVISVAPGDLPPHWADRTT